MSERKQRTRAELIRDLFYVMSAFIIIGVLIYFES